MKILKNVTLLIAITGLVTVASCTKEGPIGPQGEQGVPGPEAKTFDFTLTFDPGDEFNLFTGIIGYTTGDVVIVYLYTDTYGDNDYYVQLPFMISSNSINIWPEFSEGDGYLYINTNNADGSAGSPWASSVTLKFKAVLVHSSYKTDYPGVDFSNYLAVEEALKLED